jgi:hypothetical protein
MDPAMKVVYVEESVFSNAKRYLAPTFKALEGNHSSELDLFVLYLATHFNPLAASENVHFP